MQATWRALILAVTATLPTIALSEDNPLFDEVIVTAPQVSDPLTVVTDPKSPRQPVPAHDGADYLKNIPGFSAVRKGGTDGDPVLRGLFGGEDAAASEIMADETGIELLIARLEEIDEEISWDA